MYIEDNEINSECNIPSNLPQYKTIDDDLISLARENHVNKLKGNRR